MSKGLFSQMLQMAGNALFLSLSSVAAEVLNEKSASRGLSESNEVLIMRPGCGR